MAEGTGGGRFCGETAQNRAAQQAAGHSAGVPGLVDRFETDQKVLTAAPAGAAAPTGPATAPASPGASRTELIRVFYVVFYPYRAESPLAAG